MTSQYDHPTKEEVIAIHGESLAEFGGQGGISNMGLLVSALARPMQHENYDAGTGLFDLAAIYCEAIIKNHPFVDGNKRCGFITAVTFLLINGFKFEPEEVSVVETMLKVATGDISRDELSKWFSVYSTPDM